MNQWLYARRWHSSKQVHRSQWRPPNQEDLQRARKRRGLSGHHCNHKSKRALLRNHLCHDSAVSALWKSSAEGNFSNFEPSTFSRKQAEGEKKRDLTRTSLESWRFALRMLQHRLNLWSSQKARTQCLILDAQGQPLNDPRGLPKSQACLGWLPLSLIYPCQPRLDLPLFFGQTEVRCQRGGFAQVGDGLRAVPLPVC